MPARCVLGALVVQACAAAHYPGPEGFSDAARHELYLVAAQPEGAGYITLERIDDPKPRLMLWFVDLAQRVRRPLPLEAALAARLLSVWSDRAKVVATLGEGAAATVAGAGCELTAVLKTGDRLQIGDRRYRARRTRLTLNDREAEVELIPLPNARPAELSWVGLPNGEVAGVELVYVSPGLLSRQALRIVPNASVALLLAQKGFRAHKDGEPARALGLWQEALRLDPTSATTHYNLACAQALLGHADLAVASLERAIEYGGARFHQWARTDPDLASLMSQPEVRRRLESSHAAVK